MTYEDIALLLFFRHHVWSYILPVILFSISDLFCSSLIDLSTGKYMLNGNTHFSFKALMSLLTLCFLERICFCALTGVDIRFSFPTKVFR